MTLTAFRYYLSFVHRHRIVSLLNETPWWRFRRRKRLRGLWADAVRRSNDAGLLWIADTYAPIAGQGGAG